MVIIATQPSAPASTLPTVQSVLWPKALTVLMDIMGPSKVLIPKKDNATIKKRMMGSVLSLSQAPESVIIPLIIPPQLGAKRTMENTIPPDCTQSGKAE